MAAKVKWDRGAWWVFTHYQGKRKKKRIGPTKADKRNAEKIAKKIDAALALGAFRPSDSRECTLTVEQLAARWLRTEILLPLDRGLNGAVAPKTAQIHQNHIKKRIVPFLGTREASSLRIADVQTFYERCIEPDLKLSARTVEMTIGTLGRMLAYAEAQEIVDGNIVAAWKRSRGRRRHSSAHQPVPRTKVLDSAELERFLDFTAQEFPEWYPFILFLAHVGARLGEASALRWIDVDLDSGVARIARSFSDGQFLSAPKTGKERTVELSDQLRETLSAIRPDLFGDETLVFPNQSGGFIDPHNFRDRVFRKIVRKVFEPGRSFSPHGLRHTFVSLHMARGTNLKWIQSMGGWTSAKLLLDLYGHYLKTESSGFADAIGAPRRPYTAPTKSQDKRDTRRIRKTPSRARGSVALRAGLEPATRCLEGSFGEFPWASTHVH